MTKCWRFRFDGRWQCHTGVDNSLRMKPYTFRNNQKSERQRKHRKFQADVDVVNTRNFTCITSTQIHKYIWITTAICAAVPTAPLFYSFAILFALLRALSVEFHVPDRNEMTRATENRSEKNRRTLNDRKSTNFSMKIHSLLLWSFFCALRTHFKTCMLCVMCPMRKGFKMGISTMRGGKKSFDIKTIFPSRLMSVCFSTFAVFIWNFFRLNPIQNSK